MNHTFSIQVDAETLKADIISKERKATPSVLFLHGAGTANRFRTNYLSQKFLEHNISSLRFDFSGHGKSTGRLAESSLQKRVEEALVTFEFLDQEQPITVIGSSMGAHIAFKLLEYKKIDNLILFCPAIYATEAFTIPFTEKFSAIIRKNNSWKNSDVWKILKKFTGNLMVIIGEKDSVIPKEVIQFLRVKSPHAKTSTFLTIPESDHQIHTWLENHPNDFTLLFTKILKILHSTSSSNNS